MSNVPNLDKCIIQAGEPAVAFRLKGPLPHSRPGAVDAVLTTAAFCLESVEFPPAHSALAHRWLGRPQTRRERPAVTLGLEFVIVIEVSFRSRFKGQFSRFPVNLTRIGFEE